MFRWLAQTWGFDTNTEILDSLYTEYAQVECNERFFSENLHNSNRILADIVITGSNRFVNHVNRCFDEVKNTKWESLVAELREITECSNYADSGVNSGVYEAYSGSIGLGLFHNDAILGASVLIHEAVHTKREFSGEFDNYNYASEELIATAVQVEFLRFNGHHTYAAYLEGCDGRHNEPFMSAEFLAMQK
jgi:hypothetical protein